MNPAAPPPSEAALAIGERVAHRFLGTDHPEFDLLARIVAEAAVPIINAQRADARRAALAPIRAVFDARACSDGNCSFRLQDGGMGTNGGCRDDDYKERFAAYRTTVREIRRLLVQEATRDQEPKL